MNVDRGNVREHDGMKTQPQIAVDTVLLLAIISFLNRLKAVIFSRTVLENEGKPKSLWNSFKKILHKSSDVILLHHTNLVDLANMFGCCFF